MKTPTTIRQRDAHLRGYILEFTDAKGVLRWGATSSGALLVYQSRAKARKARQTMLNASPSRRATVRWIAGDLIVTPE